MCFLLGRNSKTVLSQLQVGSCLSSLFKAPVAAALLLTVLMALLGKPYWQLEPTMAERHLLLSREGEVHLLCDIFTLLFAKHNLLLW